MALFSKFRSSKSKAKKEAKGKEVDRSTEPAVVKVPYKHVVAHAARDSQTIPGAYIEADRPLIVAHLKRKSELAMSRNSSFLSMATASSMNETAVSVPRSSRSWRNPELPGNGLDNAYNNTWKDRQHMGLETTYEGTIEGHSEGRSEGTSDIFSAPSSSSSNSGMRAARIESDLSSAPSSSASSTSGMNAIKLEASRITPPPAVLVKDTISAKIKVVAPTIPQSAVQPQPQKSRWSLRGKRNATISVSA